MIAKKIWVIKMTKQMKGIMRVRIFLNRKQKKKKKKNQKGKKKKSRRKMMVTERKTTTLQSAGHTRWPHPLIIYFIDHCDASLNLLE